MMIDHDQQTASRILSHLLDDGELALRRDGLGLEESLVSSGLLDSVGVLRLVNFLEDEFGVEIDAEDVNLENFDTVQGIVDLLKSYRGT
jgi:acyl carrier protein